jgi:leucyl/phenylalanyl-tRNA---protein transferase
VLRAKHEEAKGKISFSTFVQLTRGFKTFRPDMLIPPDILLDLYRKGMFPMAEGKEGTIGIYDPDPRGIIEIDSFHIPDTLAKLLRSGKFEIRIDSSFEDVIVSCADRNETWISGDIIESYVLLHRLGHAHSVEAWRGGSLAGGLYGVSIGGAFFGESMFHRERDASKAALAALVARIRERGMTLLDIQYITPHLLQFGAVEIPRSEYLRRLASALTVRASFHP